MVAWHKSLFLPLSVLKHEYGFVMFSYVIPSFVVDLFYLFTHMFESCFTCTLTLIWLLHCNVSEVSNPEAYGYKWPVPNRNKTQERPMWLIMEVYSMYFHHGFQDRLDLSKTASKNTNNDVWEKICERHQHLMCLSKFAKYQNIRYMLYMYWWHTRI